MKTIVFSFFLLLLAGCYQSSYQPTYIISEESVEKGLSDQERGSSR